MVTINKKVPFFPEKSLKMIVTNQLKYHINVDKNTRSEN